MVLTEEHLKGQYMDIPKEVWKMLSSLDAFTYNHSIRVCEMCQLVEEGLNLPDKMLSEAGLLHDIGKYYISSRVLEKRGKLTVSERNFINFHAYLSYDILSSFGLPKQVCEIALYHHSTNIHTFGEDIPECKDEHTLRLALIIKTIDIFEAITSDRSYHRGISVATAVKEFENIEHDAETLNILVNANCFDRE